MESEKHLEMLQAVITRMAGNSFLLKGWSVTLISAIFALAAKDSKPGFALIAYFPAVAFWALDGYYLAQERSYRSLFNRVREDTSVPRFLMDATLFRTEECSWFRSTFSKTLLTFHGTISATVLVAMFALRA